MHTWMETYCKSSIVHVSFTEMFYSLQKKIYEVISIKPEDDYQLSDVNTNHSPWYADTYCIR